MKPRFSPSPRTSENEAQAKTYRWRSYVVLGLVVAGAIGLAARAVELNPDDAEGQKPSEPDQPVARGVGEIPCRVPALLRAAEAPPRPI